MARRITLRQQVRREVESPGSRTGRRPWPALERPRSRSAVSAAPRGMAAGRTPSAAADRTRPARRDRRRGGSAAPRPDGNLSTASGTASSRNGSSARSRSCSPRASTRGSSGTENGSFATTTISSSAPGKSTPSHRLWTPSKTPPRAMRNCSVTWLTDPSHSCAHSGAPWGNRPISRSRARAAARAR